jgi:acyl-CoA thioester hydrolase
MENRPDNPIYSLEFTVPASAVDQIGHVNNVMYVQWMQDIAVNHYEFMGGTAPMQAADAIWVVREHHVEYLLPAYAGEKIEAQTWVANIRRVRSLRKYRFLRKSDRQVLVNGETDWVFIDVKSGLPRRIPQAVVDVFTLLPDDGR